MKIIIFSSIVTVIFLLSFGSKNTATQSYFVTYLMEYKLDLKATKSLAIPNSLRQDFEEYLIAESEMKTYFTLEHIKNKSLYQFDKVENPPKKREIENYPFFYKDFTKKEIYITGGLIDVGAVKEQFIIWTYQKDTISILGYNCQKAIYVEENDTTIAWYAKDIFILDGPEHYAGLSGLILKIETNERTMTATDVIKIKNEELKVEIPIFKQIINGSDFKRKIKPH
ncbi:MAG: GLPGLI family protein [Saprospiraceae bacterium]|jgi:GLPGLI family protein